VPLANCCTQDKHCDDGDDLCTTDQCVDTTCVQSFNGDPACCGNAACDPWETCSTCPSDCGSCCGNGACQGGENCSNCPQDCGSCCGNGVCDSNESSVSCPTDCTATGGAGCWPGPAGCGGCPCMGCVCSMDSFCCVLSWDSICASECKNQCGFSCP
jgi:hypothetical protein